MEKEGDIESLPNIKEVITKLRSDGDTYGKFCKMIMPRAYGISKWKAKVTEKPIQGFMSKSFEAFVLLAYENVMYSVTSEGNSTTYKYTKNNNNMTGRNNGWSFEAIDRFNELHGRIERDRIDHPGFDDDFLKKQKEDLYGKKRKNQNDCLENKRVALNDFSKIENWSNI